MLASGSTTKHSGVRGPPDFRLGVSLGVWLCVAMARAGSRPFPIPSADVTGIPCIIGGKLLTGGFDLGRRMDAAPPSRTSPHATPISGATRGTVTARQLC